MADFPNEIRINPAVMNKLILGGVGVVLVGMGLMSSFYKVNPGEHAIVLTMGRYIGKPITEEGLKFNWPFGIDRVTKVNIAEVRPAVFGFDKATGRPRTTAHRETSQIVTGDLNIASVEWSTQYRVDKAYEYLFKVRSAVETFRDMNEAVMREVVGDRTINEVLTVGRTEIQQEVKEKLQALADQYELGIRLTQVILKDVNPPVSVKQSWNDVNQAQQEKSSMINKAEAEKNMIIPKAKGEAERTIEDARGYAIERENNAQGDADLFKQVFSAYQKAPEVTRKRIYLETIGKVLATQQRDDGKGGFVVEQGPRKIIMDEDAKGMLPLLNLNQGAK
ncbi:MAG: FtsH protease activity modulator HflK [Verrucomicrobia bacterium]|jgi:modulator of FtsH protease HflK|nr:FtsH protease activity modulator HflK [Verrucomicrobiota bacterium]MBT4901109.1 FtsH protease activity modulator HflK [Verrucomicrobiota bacterium]MBT5310548.1 FtsH protease activity modulator HflK [Verrucomicrobiota bacterium]MBT5619284.1 FtsH protease activity modulator HflK [Verrucomicrobiota bacterium]MBT6104920.1 FtsH protease activity modulator HflK [Verrucomicrobiota bacterium]